MVRCFFGAAAGGQDKRRRVQPDRHGEFFYVQRFEDHAMSLVNKKIKTLNTALSNA